MKMLLMLVLAVMTMAIACGDDDDNNDAQEFELGELDVESVEVLQLESFPVQLNVRVEGTLGACSEVGDTDLSREGNDYQVTIETRTPVDTVCTLEARLYSETIDLGSPGPGDYSVTVNGVREEFTVPAAGEGDPTSPPDEGVDTGDEPCTPGSIDPDAPVSSDDPPPCPEEPIDESQYEFGAFGVNRIDVAIAESFPVQVFVAVHGAFSDGCTEVHEVDVQQQGNVFNISITTRRPMGAICTQAIVEHSENVPLGSPAPGDYTVVVNGVSRQFTVPG